MTWPIVPLTDIAEVRLGRQRSPKNHSGDQMRPYLRAANVGWSGLLLDDVKTMNFSDAEMDTYRLRPGDIVLSEASGSPGEVGKPALWTGEIDNCAFQNTLIRVRSSAHEPRFLLHYFRYIALTGGFLPSSRGVGINHLGRARLASWPTPVPELPEQKRIVEILEDHLSRLDAAAEYMAASRRRLTAMKKATLLELIPDQSRYPRDWIPSTVAEAGTVELGRQRHPDWHTGSNMQPYLRVANVFEDRIDTTDVKEMHWDADTFERFRLRPGDVLLNEGQTPELLGRPALYRGVPANVAFTNSLIRFKANPDVLPEFALLVFRRHMHAGRFKRESRITTNIAHLSATRLKPIEFPIPPLETQRKIVESAASRLARISRLEGSIDHAHARGAALRRAVLAAAFSGRLKGDRTDDEVIEELAHA
ncbi:restriction endonuclease subunit S [Luteipulveratus flavus]|uniref:Restriction endonuclease subunit S n=1 Tax=Luteipulveratus flavus TaxID=3031728 RepID=A0ABT6C7J7_9MICO|nr:restriction endonuclease subunit S [Luteipulveratus sp. YIM 133296]MDF8264877.1 restriction endonuclease subunit S [Luteipulveratus sp. YIM 133296]